MHAVDLEKNVANSLIRLNTELARLADHVLAGRLRAEADAHFATLRSWRTTSPTPGEKAVLVAAVGRLLVLVEATGAARRHALNGARAARATGAALQA